MAVEGILSGSIAQPAQGAFGAGNGDVSRVRTIPFPLSGGSVSVVRDHVSLTAAARLSRDIAGLVQGRSDASAGAAILQVADAAFAESAETLTRLKTLATQASAEDLSSHERAILNTEFEALRSELDTIANAATFNGIALLDGSGGGTLDLDINVGGGTGAEDTITLSLQSTTVANLATGLSTARLTTAADAAAAATTVQAAIDKVGDARTDVRGLNLRLQAADADAGSRAAVSQAREDERQATRVTIDFSHLVAEEVRDQAGINPLLHDADLLRDLVASLEVAAVQAVVSEAVPARPDAASTDQPERREPSTRQAAPAHSESSDE